MVEHQTQSGFEELQNDFAQLRSDLVAKVSQVINDAQLQEDLAKFRADLTTLAHTFFGMDSREAGTTTAQPEAASENIGDKLHHAFDNTGDQHADMLAMVEKQIKEKPLVGILAAFGVGMVVSKLLNQWKRE